MEFVLGLRILDKGFIRVSPDNRHGFIMVLRNNNSSNRRNMIIDRWIRSILLFRNWKFLWKIFKFFRETTMKKK